VTIRVLACGYAVFALVAPGRMPVLCPYRRITGRRCPACGLTGAVGSALRGDPRRATAQHPLGVPVSLALCAAAVGRSGRGPREPAVDVTEPPLIVTRRPSTR
jgi:hypothetical protein